MKRPLVSIGARCWALIVALVVALAGPADAQWARLTVSLDTLVAHATRDSLDPIAKYELGIGYWTASRWDDAERALRRSVAIEPRTATSWLALSFLPYARRPRLWEEIDRRRVPPELKPRLEESARFFHRAFMVDPLVDLRIYGLILPPLMFGSASRTGQAAAQGFYGFFGGQYDAAFECFDFVLRSISPREREKHPPLGLLWYHGLAAAHTGRYEVATSDFRQLLDRALAREKSDSVRRFGMLESTELRYVLAVLDQGAGKRDSALAGYQQVLTNDLGQYMAHARMASIYEFRQQWDSAVGERRRAIETNPEDAGLVYDLGYTLAQAQRLPEARDALVQAERLNQLNARIPYVLGKVQLLLGDRAGAAESFRRFVAIAPSRFDDQLREVRQTLATPP